MQAADATKKQIEQLTEHYAGMIKMCQEQEQEIKQLRERLRRVRAVLDEEPESLDLEKMVGG